MGIMKSPSYFELIQHDSRTKPMCIVLQPHSVVFSFNIHFWLKWNITYIVSGCQSMSFRMRCEGCDIEGPRDSASTWHCSSRVTHDATVLALGSSAEPVQQCGVTRYLDIDRAAGDTGGMEALQRPSGACEEIFQLLSPLPLCNSDLK